MRKYFNKLYLSIALVVLSLLTMVATTYAWVGLLTGTTFDEFEINLEQNDDDMSDYGIQFSLDGINFFDKLEETEIQRYLLYNIDPNGEYKDFKKKNSQGNYVVNDNRITDVFRKLTLDQCTTDRDIVGGQLSNRLNRFTNMLGNETKKYFRLEFYVSIYNIKTHDDESQIDKKLNLYLRDSVLTAKTVANPTGVYSVSLFNSVKYPAVSDSLFGQKIIGNPSIPYSINEGAEIDGRVSVDISSACRVAINKFIVVDKGHPEQYVGDIYAPDGLYIYQNGGLYPTYNSSTGIYDFGGVLPDNYNFARMYYNTIHKDDQLPSVPESVINRGDIIFQDDGICNHIVNTSDGVTTSKMIGFSVYFWFEGWDADCFDVIDNKSVTVNLSFSAKSPDED